MAKDSENSDAQLLIRLPSSLKAALQREAFANKRTITAETNIRLQRSFSTIPPTPPSPYTAPNTPTVALTNDHGPAGALADTDRAMLEIFRKMPVEKQLALLSLFR